MQLDALWSGWFGPPGRPFPALLPPIIKMYPVHQLLPSSPAPHPEQWAPALRPDTARYLDACPGGRQRTRQLYLHVPFCPAFCHFCMLYKTTDPKEQSSDVIERFVRALCREIELQGTTATARAREIDCIYVGGGTPSMLTLDQVERILTTAARHLPLRRGLEVTFEGMSHQLRHEPYLRGLQALGVTRISIGVQTFHQPLRVQLGRLDTAEDVAACAEAVTRVGFQDLNMDFLMGLPGQDGPMLLSDLARATELGATSLDVLHYVATPGTRYYEMIRAGVRAAQAAGDTLLRMRVDSTAQLLAAGFHHVAGDVFDRNPARLTAFNQTHYGGQSGLDEILALGPSSYGLVDGTLYHQVASLPEYLRLISEEKLPIRAWKPLAAPQARRRALVFGLLLFRVPRHTVDNLAGRALVDSWRRRGLIEPGGPGHTLTGLGRLWFNMMQMEALPMTEGWSALDMLLEPAEQKRVLFQPGVQKGNLNVVRELETMIEGPIPALRLLRRLAFRGATSLRRPRGLTTHAGPRNVEPA
ncbi:MAG: radical SAM protein [Myxococcota bacterium]